MSPGIPEVTFRRSEVDPCKTSDPSRDALIKSVLERIGDKWSVIVVCNLGNTTLRFNELRRSTDGITQRVLASTLRGLERDGIVLRTVFPTTPPRVTYELTMLGRDLLKTVQALAHWTDVNADVIVQARREYDQRDTAV